MSSPDNIASIGTADESLTASNDRKSFVWDTIGWSELLCVIQNGDSLSDFVQQSIARNFARSDVPLGDRKILIDDYLTCFINKLLSDCSDSTTYFESARVHALSNIFQQLSRLGFHFRIDIPTGFLDWLFSGLTSPVIDSEHLIFEIIALLYHHNLIMNQGPEVLVRLLKLSVIDTSEALPKEFVSEVVLWINRELSNMNVGNIAVVSSRLTHFLKYWKYYDDRTVVTLVKMLTRVLDSIDDSININMPEFAPLKPDAILNASIDIIQQCNTVHESFGMLFISALAKFESEQKCRDVLYSRNELVVEETAPLRDVMIGIINKCCEFFQNVDLKSIINSQRVNALLEIILNILACEFVIKKVSPNDIDNVGEALFDSISHLMDSAKNISMAKISRSKLHDLKQGFKEIRICSIAVFKCFLKNCPSWMNCSHLTSFFVLCKDVLCTPLLYAEAYSSLNRTNIDGNDGLALFSSKCVPILLQATKALQRYSPSASIDIFHCLQDLCTCNFMDMLVYDPQHIVPSCESVVAYSILEVLHHASGQGKSDMCEWFIELFSTVSNFAELIRRQNNCGYSAELFLEWGLRSIQCMCYELDICFFALRIPSGPVRGYRAGSGAAVNRYGYIDADSLLSVYAHAITTLTNVLLAFVNENYVVNMGTSFLAALLQTCSSVQSCLCRPITFADDISLAVDQCELMLAIARVFIFSGVGQASKDNLIATAVSSFCSLNANKDLAGFAAKYIDELCTVLKQWRQYNSFSGKDCHRCIEGVDKLTEYYLDLLVP